MYKIININASFSKNGDKMSNLDVKLFSHSQNSHSKLIRRPLTHTGGQRIRSNCRDGYTARSIPITIEQRLRESGIATQTLAERRLNLGGMDSVAFEVQISQMIHKSGKPVTDLVSVVVAVEVVVDISVVV